MQIYGNGDKLITSSDWHTTSAGTNLVYGNVFNKKGITATNVIGTTRHTTLKAANDLDNWNFCRTPLNCSFKKGDTITISLFGVLTGKQVGDGQYKATIMSADTNTCYDDHPDDVWIKSGSRESKTIVVNADSNPTNPPYVLIYSGKAGNTGGNTLEINDLKVERGSIATQWSPAPQEYAMKSDYDKLLGVGNLLTDDEMNIANALKSTAAQGAISNINYLNGVSRFHYKGISSYEVINWPFKVSPNTNYRMEIVVNSTNELTALDNTMPYIPWGINSKENLTDASSGDIGNWHLPLPWSKEISGSITFNSGSYSKLYLIANFGFANDGIDTDVTLQIKLFRNDSIQTQIDQLRSQIEQLKQSK